MSNQGAEKVKRAIDNLFEPSTVKILGKDDTPTKKSIVILADYCGNKTHIAYNYTNDIAIEPEITREVSRLVSEGYKNIRVIKGIELEYPFKIV